ncbi:MAG: O-antigen ligase family protein [bacterium]
MLQVSVQRFFDRLNTSILCVLAMGNPLIFSSLTRSVFEVNKLLLLRTCTLLLLALCGFKFLLDHYNSVRPDLQRSYTIFGFRWRRVGLEIPLLLYLIVTLLTCVFSTNVWLAIIGSYDRWEGIFTVSNYVVLIYLVAKICQRKWQFFMLFTVLILATCFSALYGVFQSLGFDWMAWSEDPTFRVFACINNPVHFCAFMGMMFPFSAALYLYFLHRDGLFQQGQRSLLFWKLFKVFLCLLLYLLAFLILRWVSADVPFQALTFVFSWLFLGFIVLSYCSGLKASLVYVFFGLGSLAALQYWEWQSWLCFCFCMFLAGNYCVFALPNRVYFLRRLFFVLGCLVFYAQILSYSRATFVGFNLFIPFFFVLLSGFMIKGVLWKRLLFCLTLLGGFSFYNLFFTFNVIQYGVLFKVAFTLFYLCFMSVLYLFYRDRLTFFNFLMGTFLLYLLHVCLMYIDNIGILFGSSLLTIVLYFFFLFVPSYRPLYFVIGVQLFFVQVQFLGFGIERLFFSLIFLFLNVYVLAFSYSKQVLLTKKAMLSLSLMVVYPYVLTSFSFLKTEFLTFVYEYQLWYLIFVLGGLCFLFFTFYVFHAERYDLFVRPYVVFLYVLFAGSLCVSFFYFPSFSMAKFQFVQSHANYLQRSQALTSESATKRNSRLYMWTSVPAWFKDYSLLGSGLDTVKFLFPLYRDPVYGIYEGAHNYTPDRLHNEYLNTLVTRGSLGFFVYYFMVILGVFVLIIRGLQRHIRPWVNCFLGACFVSLGVYLGQVIFNFGVVPTLVLFYMVMGLAIGLCSYSPFLQKIDSYDK